MNAKQMELVEKELTAKQKEDLLKPIDEYVKNIQKKIDALRVDGENKLISLKEEIATFKRDKELSDEERMDLILKDQELIEQAKIVKQENAQAIKDLIIEAEMYLQDNYNLEYYDYISANCALLKDKENESYRLQMAQIKEEHLNAVANINAQLNAAIESNNEEAKANAQAMLKNEKQEYKTKKYDLKTNHTKVLQDIRDEKHEAFIHKYHLIDALRNSRFTFFQKVVQYAENKIYNFHLTDFLLKNGLTIVIILFFIVLVIIAPIKENVSLLSLNHILAILENSSTRVFLALGVAGLILLGGTDLSIGRMIGLSTTITAIIWHQGDNAIKLFGSSTGLNFDSWPLVFRLLVSLLICVALCSLFSSIAGFFTAKFKMHPFISTMANQLIIFGLWFYITKGTASGGVDERLVNIVTPRWGMFPSIIIWAIVCIVVVWFIWNKTRFGKNMYAVGGNQEAAAVSGISVFWTTIFVFIMAGILYGLGGWLECSRAKGSASAGYGGGWETDAIAACVVGGISFSGGVGKIGGAVFGVVIFTALTYALSILNIDTNLQFVIKGIIILAAVAMDSIKYLKKK